MTRDAWLRLMAAWDLPESLDIFERLVAAHGEGHRHYHNADHVNDCLAQLDAARSLAERPEEIEMALWFHDAVYKPTSAQNEEKSAEWARSFLQEAGAQQTRTERVVALILATKHDIAPAAGDPTLMVDIDLSILGRDPEAYDRFEKNVRKEYRWVPKPLYRRKRREILESFLSRPVIYGTEHFRRLYEEPARENLRRTVEALR